MSSVQATVCTVYMFLLYSYTYITIQTEIKWTKQALGYEVYIMTHLNPVRVDSVMKQCLIQSGSVRLPIYKVWNRS